MSQNKYIDRKLFIMFIRNNLQILTGNNSMEIEELAVKLYDDAIKFQKPSHIEWLKQTYGE
jgi:hypothetical protein